MTPAGTLAAAAVVIALVIAGALILPAARRTGLGVAHPAFPWLALHAVFFGLGGALLAGAGLIDPAVAWYVAGAAAAGGLGVFASDRLARRRGTASPPQAATVTTGTHDGAPARWPVVLALLGFAGAAVAPMLLATGLPLLSGDPTGARLELAGLAVQPLRVALPAAGVIAVLAAIRTPTRRTVAGAVLGLGAALAFTILLASRYLGAELVACLMIAWMLAGRRVKASAVVGIGLAGLLVFGAVQVVRAPDRSSGRELAFAVERTVARVTLVQVLTQEALMAAIPAERDHFGGLTWLRRVAPLVGVDDVPNLGYWIYPRLFPDQDPGVRGYAAPGLIGEAWANFGIAGLALFAGLGAGLERMGAVLGRRRTGTADIAAGALGVMVLARTHALGLNGTLVLLALVAAWRLLAADPRSLLADVRLAVAWRT